MPNPLAGKEFRPGLIVNAIDNAAFTLTGYQFVGICRNSVLKTCSAAKQAVFFVKLAANQLIQGIFNCFKRRLDKFPGLRYKDNISMLPRPILSYPNTDSSRRR